MPKDCRNIAEGSLCAFLYTLLLILSTLIVAGLWVTGFLCGLSPERWGWLSLIGYAFPFFIVMTIISMLVCVFIRKRYILIPILGLLVAYYPVTLYCPLNFVDEASEGGKGEEVLKVMSYNTCNWGMGYSNADVLIQRDLTNEEKYQIMVDYFRSVDADIVAVQEGNMNTEILDSLRTMYNYIDTVYAMGTQDLSVMLMSRYPITRKENLNLPSRGNGAGAFWVNVKGREVIVIATHLESMGFSNDEKAKFSTMMHGNEENRDSVRSTSRTIFGKILLATKKRARQAELIARFINGHTDTSGRKSSLPIIVMGDFNDIPQSYTHAIIADQLTDCYRECGLGPGYSFRHFGMRVRIDNILCSEDITPLSCKVDDNIELSDHLPIIATLKVR